MRRQSIAPKADARPKLHFAVFIVAGTPLIQQSRIGWEMIFQNYCLVQLSQAFMEETAHHQCD